jgi:hypothetical protein
MGMLTSSSLVSEINGQSPSGARNALGALWNEFCHMSKILQRCELRVLSKMEELECFSKT